MSIIASITMKVPVLPTPALRESTHAHTYDNKQKRFMGVTDFIMKKCTKLHFLSPAVLLWIPLSAHHHTTAFMLCVELISYVLVLVLSPPPVQLSVYYLMCAPVLSSSHDILCIFLLLCLYLVAKACNAFVYLTPSFLFLLSFRVSHFLVSILVPRFQILFFKFTDID